MDYGIIGNGKTAALISSKGSIDWCCLPDFDSPSIFGRILDESNGGFFSIEPVEPCKTEQYYLRNTNVLETVFKTKQGKFKVTDFMPRDQNLIDGTDYETYSIIRIIEPLEGHPAVTVRYEPRLDYGRSDAKPVLSNEGLLRTEGIGQRIYLNSSLDTEYVMLQKPVPLSEPLYFVISQDKPVALKEVLKDVVTKARDETIRYWRDWIKQCHLPACYQDAVIRSALTLKLLVYEKTGAIIAAPTTSLPEESGSNRNWDYRYCWIRDALFSVSVLFELSLFREKERYISFLEEVLLREDDYIKPLFTVHGDEVSREYYLDHWSGFRDSLPVRIGNNATEHYQDDVYGEMMLALHEFFTDRRFVHIDTEKIWRIVLRLVEMAEKRFGQKDSGPWEFNNNLDHFTFSKAMCWVTLDRAARIAELTDRKDQSVQWSETAMLMKEEILEKAWNPELKAFTQAYGSEHLDATTLLLPILGFISAKDERMLSTVKVTEEKLGKNGFIFRYTHEDDFGRPKNAFLVCTFWLIDNWILSGQIEKARNYFEKMLAHGNYLGLFSEHIEPDTGEMTGNFPQGYTHVAIIYTAMMLSYTSLLERGFGYFQEL